MVCCQNDFFNRARVVQFFLTTHSPVVASDVKGKVFTIDNGEVRLERTYGKLSKDILSSVFDLSNARSLTVQSMIDSAYNAIEDNNPKTFNKYLVKLTDILGADDVDVVGLKIEKTRRDRYFTK